ncbi:MAG: LptE family protein [Bacteroidetes bacterium]|nr:LptE family protein [Bacteroidota bacterium]MBS1974372.1 LptE family protein [Bacteroidota bacterium]
MNKVDTIKNFSSTGSAMLIAVLFSFAVYSCGIYSFKDVSIPPDVKTIHLGYIENKARYVNPQLSPQLTDKLKQKINNQTRLTQVESGADWDVSAYVSSYDISTASVSNQKSATNRLTVTVHITFHDSKDEKKNYEADVSRNFDFDANASFSQAEPGLLQQILTTMTDDIFNRLFSNW